MTASEVGRPIYGSDRPSSPPPAEFSAKDEPIEGRFAKAILKLGLNDVRVISSVGERLLYARDQSEIPRFMKQIMFYSMPEVVVQPESTEAVSALLKFASSKGVKVVPRGSASSPFGGASPVLGGMVLDASTMDKILEIDVEKLSVKVQGGVRWADLDHELERKGLALNTCPSSKFSTVAGWISTGGMGLNSYSRGHLKNSVLELELVVPDGSVRAITKSSPLFDTVFGSEGQLGIITSATISVRRRPEKSHPHLVMFDDFREALRFATTVTNSSVRPVHILYEDALKFKLVNRMLGKEHFPARDAIIVYIESEESEQEFRELLKNAGLQEEKEYLARYMWNERFFPMKMRRFGPGMLGSEVLVPNEILENAMAKAVALCQELSLEPMFEMHFLPGGQVLLLCYYVTDQGNTIGFTLDAAKSMILSSMLIDMGAKPYSIGIWNTAFSNAEDRGKIARLKEAKNSLDPKGLMNPGKYFSLSGRFGGALGLAFSPGVMRPALKTMRVFSPLTMRFMRTGYKFAERRLRPKARSELLQTADECAMCGACVNVCPAYLVVGDERVTARGKLLAVKAMARGGKLSKEHADRIFLCMRCKACEQVCQSKLALVDAYDKLERELEESYGRNKEQIETFVKYAEAQPELDRLLERGLVLGAPKQGAGGDAGDV